MIAKVFLLSCISIMCVISQEVTVRRDEEWPPKVIKEVLIEKGKLCREKTGATDEIITRFSDKDIHDHPDLKCYIKCIMSELKTMDEDGNIDPTPMIEMMEKTEKWVQKILLAMGRKCIRLKLPKGTDLCEKAFLLQKCMKEADPVHYFLY